MRTRLGSRPLAAAARQHPPVSWRGLAIGVIALDLVVLQALAGGAPVPSVAMGADRGDPITLLGTTFAAGGCTSAPQERGPGRVVECAHFVAITSADGRALVIKIAADGVSGMPAYAGPMPLALHWHETVPEVVETLGDPSRITPIYGTPTFVYMLHHGPIGSVELRFDDHLELVQVNASVFG